MNLLEDVTHIKEHAEQLYSAVEVEKAIDKMAEKINLLLADRNPILLTVLNGGIVTAGKLMTRLHFPLTIDAIDVRRYHDNTIGGEIVWKHAPGSRLNGRTILIVDDILDKGLTLQAIYQYCEDNGALSIYSAVLINKLINQPKPVQADFIGLETNDRYLFGYGMDYKGYLRNAPGIYACNENL